MLIIFDLDDTLIDTSGSITPFQLEIALKEMVSKGLSVKNFQATLNLLIALDKKCKSSRETLKFFLKDSDQYQKFYSIGIDKIYGEISPKCKIFTVPQALETVKLLSKKHNLSIVTAGNPNIQLHKLEKAGMDRSFFCKIHVSATKNKKKYFESLIQNFSFGCDKVLVCGDKVDIDLMPAKKLGCTTVLMQWGRGRNQPKCEWIDYTTSSLPELYKILEEL